MMLDYLDLAGSTLRLKVRLESPVLGLGSSNLDMVVKYNTNLDCIQYWREMIIG